MGLFFQTTSRSAVNLVISCNQICGIARKKITFLQAAVYLKSCREIVLISFFKCFMLSIAYKCCLFVVRRFLERALVLNQKYHGARSLKVAVSFHLVARTQSCMGDFRLDIFHISVRYLFIFVRGRISIGLWPIPKLCLLAMKEPKN
jgi:hypothetical protein